MDLLKSDTERWRVSLFGDRLHVITDDDADDGDRATTGRSWKRKGFACISAREGRFSLEDVFIASSRKRRQAGQGRGRRTETDMRRILAQARKELTQIVRDRLALGLALVLPADAADPAGHRRSR